MGVEVVQRRAAHEAAVAFRGGLRALSFALCVLFFFGVLDRM